MRTSLCARRRARSILIALSAALALAAPRAAAAAGPPPAHPGFYAELGGGPAFATYLPIDPQGTDNEHLATGGSLVGLGVGYGFEPPWLRIDLGLRVQNLHVGVAGAYSNARRDDAFRANYDYLAPMVSATITTRLHSRVNPFLGVALGTATLFSDGQGRGVNVRQLPVFGFFEAGVNVRLTDWLETRGGVAWLPPFGRVNMLAPVLALRAQF